MKEFVEYLQGRQRDCLEKAKEMTQDLRVDEGNLEKVRANIFGVFATLAQMPGKTADFVVGKMEEIPKAWHESLAKAIQHNDHEKEAQERVKIAAMAEIGAKFAALEGRGDCDESDEG